MSITELSSRFESLFGGKGDGGRRSQRKASRKASASITAAAAATSDDTDDDKRRPQRKAAASDADEDERRSHRNASHKASASIAAAAAAATSDDDDDKRRPRRKAAAAAATSDASDDDDKRRPRRKSKQRASAPIDDERRPQHKSARRAAASIAKKSSSETKVKKNTRDDSDSDINILNEDDFRTWKEASKRDKAPSPRVDKGKGKARAEPAAASADIVDLLDDDDLVDGDATEALFVLLAALSARDDARVALTNPFGGMTQEEIKSLRQWANNPTPQPPNDVLESVKRIRPYQQHVFPVPKLAWLHASSVETQLAEFSVQGGKTYCVR